MELIEFSDGDEGPATVPASAGIVIGAIVGLQLGTVIVLLAVWAGAVGLLGQLFGPSLDVFARTAGLG